MIATVPVWSPKALADYAREILKALPESVRRVAILGGGALRAFFDGTPVKDYDIFFRTHEEYLFARSEMARLGYLGTHDGSSLARTFWIPDSLVPFNFVGFRHMEPKQLVASFDFTCCAMAAWMEGDDVRTILHGNAVLDAYNRRLVLNSPRPTKQVLKRLARYVERYEYTITDKLVEQLQECFNVPADGEPDTSNG